MNHVWRIDWKHEDGMLRFKLLQLWSFKQRYIVEYSQLCPPLVPNFSCSFNIVHCVYRSYSEWKIFGIKNEPRMEYIGSMRILCCASNCSSYWVSIKTWIDIYNMWIVNEPAATKEVPRQTPRKTPRKTLRTQVRTPGRTPGRNCCCFLLALFDAAYILW